MIDHVDIRVSDRGASERFYATVLPVLGKERVSADESCTDYRDFAFHVGGPPTRNLHIAFYAPSTELVDR